MLSVLVEETVNKHTNNRLFHLMLSAMKKARWDKVMERPWTGGGGVDYWCSNSLKDMAFIMPPAAEERER